MLVYEEVEKRIGEVGGFSSKLEEILLFLLKETQDIRTALKSETSDLKELLENRTNEIAKNLQDETTVLKDVIRKENSDRKKELLELETFTKQENAERKMDINQLKEKLMSEEEKRALEAKALQEKMERERKALQDYVEKDARETKQKMELENKSLKEKLDREAADLKKKMQDADDEKAEEMRILQQRLDTERKLLSDKMEREKAELAEEMERAESERKKEAASLKNKMEEEAKQTQNGIVTMFERLKGENETRKMEIHGLKDILVRENEKLARDQMALGQRVDASLEEMTEKLDKESTEIRKELKRTSDDIIDTMKSDKKEVKDKLDNDYSDLKKKLEMETNEIRDKMQFDRKAMAVKFEEVEDERQKEAKLIRAQLQREREETRDLINSENKMMQDQMDNNTKDLLDIIKKEKHDREREVESVKRRIDDEKQELQLSIDRDRDNLTKKLNEEHDQRRIEQMEVQQRLENTEKSGKNDIQELFTRVKRYEEEARIDNDELRQNLTRTASLLDEKISREKKELREALDHESNDLSKRVDKCNLERMNESADFQSKLAMLGKSASRHLDSLKHALQRETQNLLDLISKPSSVLFNAYRDEGHADGGECYMTFSGCNTNIGNGFIPKSGIFQCPDPGLYLFTLTVCTYDGKKCLVILKKNEKDICAMIDQDGNENRGKTMISQTCILELEINDRVQIYMVTGTGITDMKNSHYTQFTGIMLRPSLDTYRQAARLLTQMEDEDISIGDGSLRGYTPGPNGDISRSNRRNASVTRGPSVTRQLEGSERQNGVSSEKERNGMTSPVPVATSPPPPPLSPVNTPAQPANKNASAPPLEEKQTNGNSPSSASDKDKPQQSYLALTKLGGGEEKSPKEKSKQSDSKEGKNVPPSPAQTPATKKKDDSFYSFLKR